MVCLLHLSDGLLWMPYLDDMLSYTVDADVQLFQCGNLQMQIKDVSCLDKKAQNLPSQVRCEKLDPSGIR